MGDPGHTEPHVEPHVEPHFVFRDAGGRRWRGVRALGVAAGVAGAGLLSALGISLALRPSLPRLPLGLQQAAAHRDLGLPAPGTATPISGALPVLPTARAAAGAHDVVGYFVNWDDNSMTSLRRHFGALTELDPEWLHLTAQGGVREDDPLKRRQVVGFLQSVHAGLRIMPLVNNYDSAAQRWDSQTLATSLNDPARRATLEAALLAVVRDPKMHAAGLTVDFENVPAEAQDGYTRLVGDLHAQLAPLHKQLNIAVPLDDDDFQYAALGRAADRVQLMAYELHDESSAAGPVAPQGWVQDRLQDRLDQLPANKTVLAIGNYGYDWTGAAPGGQELAFQDALTTAKESEGQVRLDPSTLNPTFDYFDDANKRHHVWYLDAASSFDQVAAARRLGVGRVALWRLGTEDPGVWRVLRHQDQLAAQLPALASLHYGYDLDYQGRGELLKVVQTPRDGRRDLSFDAARGLLTGETLRSYASPFVIGRWGGHDPKKIALTFDDGPDPTWTPRILDILQREHVPATFFVVGLNGEAHPDLLRREVSAGFEVGSHTFTHPNLSMVTPGQFDLELAATQRLLEGTLGRRSLLFRPPFAEDVEPDTPDHAQLLMRASREGYYTVGMQIDPDDWAKPGAQHIVNEVLRQAESGSGNVVLLHDAGGDRSQTLAALPQIIHELRAHGYQLVGVSQLAGLSRDQVMPKVGGLLAQVTRLDSAGFGLFALVGALLATLFTIGIVLSCVRLALVSGLALLETAARRRTLPAPDRQRPLTVLVPAYNEAKVIAKTVGSLLTQGEHVRVLVIDDGSQDDTEGVVRRAYGGHPHVAVERIPNGGKAAALNFGVARAGTDVVVVIDADTVLDAGALVHLAGHFVDPQVAAVAGNAKVGNRVNLLTRWQALEYITAQNLERRALALLNCVSVVPGAIGAWRRGALLAAGGFATDTLAEDADLTLRLLRRGWRVTYDQRAIARTEAPDTVRGFLKQRFRWMYGTLQATWKQKDALWRSQNRWLGAVTVPNVVVFQVLLPLISAALDLYMLGSLAWTAVQHRYHPDAAGAGNHALPYYLLFLAVDLLAAVLAFALEPSEDWRLLFWLPFQRFFYRQLLYLVAIRAALAALRGRAVGWGKLERRGSVAAAPEALGAGTD